jgi:hypothetical protein
MINFMAAHAWSLRVASFVSRCAAARMGRCGDGQFNKRARRFFEMRFRDRFIGRDD